MMLKYMLSEVREIFKSVNWLIIYCCSSLLQMCFVFLFLSQFSQFHWTDTWFEKLNPFFLYVSGGKKGMSKSSADRRLPANCSDCFKRQNYSKQRDPQHGCDINRGLLLLFLWTWMTMLNMLLTILQLLCTVFIIWWSLHSLSHYPVIFCWSLYFSSM